jgi:mersacidin/lichenicidin family type 2 lantibiotic
MAGASVFGFGIRNQDYWILQAIAPPSDLTNHQIQLRKGKQMPTSEVVRAWKDEDYRETLTAEQREQLPPHPSGVIEFEEPRLEDESLFGPAAGRCKFVTHHTLNHGNKCQ